MFFLSNSYTFYRQRRAANRRRGDERYFSSDQGMSNCIPIPFRRMARLWDTIRLRLCYLLHITVPGTRGDASRASYCSLQVGSCSTFWLTDSFHSNSNGIFDFIVSPIYHNDTIFLYKVKSQSCSLQICKQAFLCEISNSCSIIFHHQCKIYF